HKNRAMLSLRSAEVAHWGARDAQRFTRLCPDQSFLPNSAHVFSWRPGCARLTSKTLERFGRVESHDPIRVVGKRRNQGLDRCGPHPGQQLGGGAPKAVTRSRLAPAA